MVTDATDAKANLAAPMIEKTARNIFQAVKRPRSWKGLRSAIYAWGAYIYNCNQSNFQFHHIMVGQLHREL